MYTHLRSYKSGGEKSRATRALALGVGWIFTLWMLKHKKGSKDLAYLAHRVVLDAGPASIRPCSSVLFWLSPCVWTERRTIIQNIHWREVAFLIYERFLEDRSSVLNMRPGVSLQARLLVQLGCSRVPYTRGRSGARKQDRRWWRNAQVSITWDFLMLFSHLGMYTSFMSDMNFNY